MSVYAHRSRARTACSVIADEPSGVVAGCVLSDLGFELGGEGEGLKRRVAVWVGALQACWC